MSECNRAHVFLLKNKRMRGKRKSDGRKILQFFSIALGIMYEKGAEWILLFSSHFSRKLVPKRAERAQTSRER